MQTVRRLLLALRVALLVLAAALTTAVATARAAEPPTAIVIFDGSGSMWGRIDGERQSKFVMAREAIRPALGRLAPETRIGLMSFGHRRGGDCQDTEVIQQPAPVNVERVLEPLEKLNPKGRGPITKALREAAPLLGPQSAPASIVLLHDGLDNCQQDPCTLMGELRAAHPRLRVHVVSIGLSAEDAAPMACLPQQTGGKHFVVASTAEINAAVGEAMRLSGEAGQPAAPKPAPKNKPAEPKAEAPGGPGVPQGRPGLQLWASLVKGGPAVAVPVHWVVRRAGDKSQVLWEGTTPAPLLLMPTGRYDIEARSGLVTRQAVAEAVEGQPRSLGIVLDAGTLALAQTESGARALDDTVISLVRVDPSGPSEPRILRSVEPELALPPGTYLVQVTSGTMRIERPVGIVAGQRVSIAGSLNLGNVELSAASVKGGPPLDDVIFTVFEDDPDAPQGRRELARSAAPNPRFKLPAGGYYVVARRGAAEARDRIAVRTGDSVRHVLVLDAGQLQLSVRVAGGRLASEGPIAHRIERLDPQARDVVNASGTAARFDLAAGRYRLETRVGLANAVIQRELAVRAGQVERVDVDHDVGVARLRLLDKAGGTPVPDVGWEIRDASGKAIWVGLGIEARALLMAGRYAVVAQGRGYSLERAIDVRTGDDRAFDLVR